MLFTEQQHLCKAVSVARKQFQLSGTHAHSLHLKPLQYVLKEKICQERVRIGVEWTRPVGGTFSSPLHLSSPIFPHSLDSSSISGFGWPWVQHRNEIIINKTKAHGISALLGVLYVASCLDLSHTYICYPHVPSGLFLHWFCLCKCHSC